MSAAQAIEDALQQFEALVGNIDASAFQGTRIQDVYQAARVIEHERQQDMRMCNLKRVEPLLGSLSELVAVVESLCTATSQLCYLWAPIKLLLQIADGSDKCLKQLLSAYFELAKRLPHSGHLARLTPASDFTTHLIANLCTDILEFHSKTYLLLRRESWEVLFNASWKDFSAHLECILQRLSRARSTIDYFVNASHTLSTGHTYTSTQIGGNATVVQGDIYNSTSIHQTTPELTLKMCQDIDEANHFRKTITANFEKQQKEQNDSRLRQSIDWLQLGGYDQIQQKLFRRRADSREDDTCAWILAHTNFRNWLNYEHGRKFLWLKGNPGAGKTTLATFVIDKAVFPAGSIVVLCACAQELETSSMEPYDLAFRHLIATILRQRHDLVPYVYDDYVNQGHTPSTRVLLSLAKVLLTCVPSTYLIIDALDECDPEIQDVFFKKLDKLLNSWRAEDGTTEPIAKVLICSRDTKSTPLRLRKQPVISLQDEIEHVSKDIKLYASRKLQDLCDRLSEAEIAVLETDIVEKANGMFLWVKLVIAALLDQESVADLQMTILDLPVGLQGIYRLILQKMELRSDERTRDYILRAFTWLILTHRPMKTWELCDALVLSDLKSPKTLNQFTKLGTGVLDHCKPLLEIGLDGTVSLIHFSLKEFFLSHASGHYVQPDSGYDMTAIACIRYFLSCEDFFRSQQPVGTARDIVLGFHSLFPYFHKYWKHHLVSRPVSRHGRASCGPLYSCAADLREDCRSPQIGGTSAHAHEKLTAFIKTEIGALVSPHDSIDPMEQRLAGEILLDVVNAIDIPSAGDQEKKSADEARDEKINLAYECFRHLFENLLQDRSPYTNEELEITETDLVSFKARYAMEAYLCTKKDCSRSVRGFNNPEERDKHVLRHANQFRCPRDDCEFASTGFAKHAALMRHIAKYHNTLSESIVPKLKLRRKRARSKSSLVGNADTAMSSDQGDESDEVYTNKRPNKRGKRSLVAARSIPDSIIDSILHGQVRAPERLPSDSDESRGRRRSSVTSITWTKSETRRPPPDDELSDAPAQRLQIFAPESNVDVRDIDILSPAVTSSQKWKDKNGRTYLARACSNNDLEAATARLSERLEDLDMADNAGNTPLQIAALEGFEEIVEFLLSKGADVNTRNVDKDTPLIDAVENGHVEVIKLLLMYGANPRMANARGEEPYELVHPMDEAYEQIQELLANAKHDSSQELPRNSPSIGPGTPRSFSALRRKGKSESSRNDLLWHANTQENLAKLAGKGDIQGVASILSILEKAEPESLIAAARAGHVETLQLLIAIGKPDPDPDPIRSSRLVPGHNTPMMAAIGRGHPDVVKLLVSQSGFNPRRKYKDRRYYELAQDRQGDRWEEEYDILKQAFSRAEEARINSKEISSRAISASSASTRYVSARATLPDQRRDNISLTTQKIDAGVDGEEDDPSENEIVRCICGYADYPGLSGTIQDLFRELYGAAALTEDMGNFFIQCDDCHAWQHGGCVGVAKKSDMLDSYYCDKCRPDLHRISLASDISTKSSQYLPASERSTKEAEPDVPPPLRRSSRRK